jgi:hypothetical protein
MVTLADELMKEHLFVSIKLDVAGCAKCMVHV